MAGVERYLLENVFQLRMAHDVFQLTMHFHCVRLNPWQPCFRGGSETPTATPGPAENTGRGRPLHRDHPGPGHTQPQPPPGVLDSEQEMVAFHLQV